jgi:hypothetical protein
VPAAVEKLTPISELMLAQHRERFAASSRPGYLELAVSNSAPQKQLSVKSIIKRGIIRAKAGQFAQAIAEFESAILPNGQTIAEAFGLEGEGKHFLLASQPTQKQTLQILSSSLK